MKVSSAALTSFLLTAAGANAFSNIPSAAFVSCRTTATTTTTNTQTQHHGATCTCQGCTSMMIRIMTTHRFGCLCATCAGRSMVLFMSSSPEAVVETASQQNEEEDNVPAEVEAMDGIATPEEAHNAERPARKSLSKKPKGKPLSEFKAGDKVMATVKAVTGYGAFLDFGASTDGLLHISQLSVDFVENVKDVVDVGQEIEVRIMKVDEAKNQVTLTLLSKEEQVEAKESADRSRQQQPPQASSRRDDSAVVAALVDKGWDDTKMVDGTVVSAVDFGAFIRLDVSQLNADVQGTVDGLVHISELTLGRAESVASVVKLDDKVKVRLMAVSGGKVSLSMVSLEDIAAAQEQARASRGGGGGGGGGRSQSDSGYTSSRRDDSGVLAALMSKGWDSDQFVTGTVVSTVDFGAFVRVDASQLNSEVSGEFDGLVHISALSKGRTESVTSVVNVNDTVQVRVKSVGDRKVSLSMVASEDEAVSYNASLDRGSGNREWKSELEKVQSQLPTFKNMPQVVNLRK